MSAGGRCCCAYTQPVQQGMAVQELTLIRREARCSLHSMRPCTATPDWAAVPWCCPATPPVLHNAWRNPAVFDACVLCSLSWHGWVLLPQSCYLTIPANPGPHLSPHVWCNAAALRARALRSLF